MQIPGFSGIEALRVVRERGIDVPFIFVSGTIGEDTAVDAMRSGAQDYVMKGNLRRLGPAIQRELEEAVVRRARRRAEQRLHYLAHHDALTGLPNRLLFMDRLQQALYDAERHDRLVAVAFVDLDRFKTVNDTLGHAVGDRLLEAVALRLSACVRSGDTVARLSGDEFTLVLADMAHPEDAASEAQKILDSLTLPFRIDDRELYIGASLGITLCPLDAGDPESLLRYAVSALHQAKRQGRNNFQFFTQAMGELAAESLALEHDLRRDIERGEFELHYQPIVETGARRIVPLEPQLRWERPGHGAIEPSSFIPLAEEIGLIVPLGDWVLEHACYQAALWLRDGISTVPIAVNISAVQFRRGDLAELVQAALEAAGLPGSALAIELTETALLDDPQLTTDALARLRHLGVQVSLDDFGTGYSSLAYLNRLPLDHLKIDRSFIQHAPDRSDATAIASAIIAIGRRLGLGVVAEGVETERQAEFLSAEGCDLMQGYLFGRPLPAAEVEPRLRQATGAEPTGR
ncbi:MAG: EAL domain-containing response regulator [Gemmatimonadota bacterium]